MTFFSQFAKVYLLGFQGSSAPVGEVTGDIGCHQHWQGISAIQINWIGPDLSWSAPDGDVVEVIIEADVLRWEDKPLQPRREFSCTELVQFYFSPHTGDLLDVEWYDAEVAVPE